MIIVAQFFLIYLLSYFGFLLGKITKYEHIEIRSRVKAFIFILTILFYLFMIFFSGSRDVGTVLIPMLVLYVFIMARKVDTLVYFHHTVLYCLIFFFTSMILPQYFFLTFIPLALVLLENSFIDFDLRKEIGSFLLICFMFAIFYFGFYI